MSDRVFLALPGIGTLAFSRDAFEAALRSGRELAVPAPAASEPKSVVPGGDAALLDAEQLEKITRVPRSWWMTRARQRRIPCRKMGRRVRFVLDEVLACEEFKRAAVGATPLPGARIG